MVNQMTVPVSNTNTSTQSREGPIRTSTKKESWWQRAWRWFITGVKVVLAVVAGWSIVSILTKTVVAIVTGAATIGTALATSITKFATGVQEFAASPITWTVKKVSELVTVLKASGKAAEAGRAAGAAAAAAGRGASAVETAADVAGVSVIQEIRDVSYSERIVSPNELSFMDTVRNIPLAN